MRGRRIRARGAGPAAFAVAKLLLDRGAEVVVDAATPRKRRIVAISMETVALAARIFNIDPDELKIGPIVEERHVNWSIEGAATMPDAALVCDAGDFSAVLASSLRGATIANLKAIRATPVPWRRLPTPLHDTNHPTAES